MEEEKTFKNFNLPKDLLETPDLAQIGILVKEEACCATDYLACMKLFHRIQASDKISWVTVAQRFTKIWPLTESLTGD